MNERIINSNIDKLVSVIIPVYNTEDYLRQCLSSILNQDYKNIEIIIVNDGSTDKSIEICKEFAANDKRIIIVDSENMGAASARNRGLEKASGDYVVFMDSDDWVEPLYVKRLTREIEEKRTDLVIGGRAVYKDGRIEKALYPSELLAGSYQPERIRNDFIKHYLEDFKLGGNFAKIYKRSIIENNKIRFNENITINEDILFNIEYLLNCKSAGIIDTADYFYRQREGSVTSLYDEGAGIGISMVAVEKHRLVSEHGFMTEECRHIINRWFVLRLLYYYKRTVRDHSYIDFKKRNLRTKKLTCVLNEGLQNDNSLLKGISFKSYAAAYVLGKFRIANRVATFASHIRSIKGRHS